MKFSIKHEIEGRLRIHIIQENKMTDREADALAAHFSGMTAIKNVRVYERTADMVLEYNGDRKFRDDLLKQLQRAKPAKLAETVEIPENSVRGINRRFTERLTDRIMLRAASRLLLPMPVRNAVTTVNSVRYFYHALEGLADKKADTRLLDAAGLAAAFLRSDYEGAGSVVFLLDLGHILESWLEKQKAEGLSETMQLNIDYAWLKQPAGEEPGKQMDKQPAGEPAGEVRIPMEKVNVGDILVVHEGEMIPFDGIVTDGAGSVVQTSMTGNALPQPMLPGSRVFAGTALEEGNLTIRVVHPGNLSRYDKIVSMVDNMQNLKPEFESQALLDADRKVPYMLGGSAITWLLTRNTDRALSFVNVDFSAALKLALPKTVLQARKEAQEEHMIVRGGRFMENMAAADVIVFDKTGTLTKAQPVLRHVYSFGNYTKDRLLWIAAAMEVHMTDPVAAAIVHAAHRRGLMFVKVLSETEKVLAHGVAANIGGKRTLVGSYHYIFEDEGCSLPEGEERKLFDREHVKEHHIFLAVDRRVEGVFIVEDELKEEVTGVIEALREEGFSQVVMLTGDAELSAKEAAGDAGVDEYYAEKLPEEKADYIQKLQREGHKVVMVGDGVNDSLALSVADVGIALGKGAEVSIKLADVVIDDIDALVELRRISVRMMREMKKKYSLLKWTNGILIALGASGIIQPQNMVMASHAATIAITFADRKERDKK